MKKKKGTKIALITLAIMALIVVGIMVPHQFIPTIPSGLCISQHTENAPKLIAHRGFSGIYPQNTIPAFEGAVKADFWGMECDIHTTKDGRWVVIHDDEISNLTNGEGYIKDMTFEEIQKIEMDSGNGIENYGTLPIPTLEEYLSVCHRSDIVPVIEIKSCDTKYLPDLKAVLEVYELSDRAVIISFNKDYLTQYRKLDKEIPILYLCSCPTKEDIDFCVENSFGINFHFFDLIKCASAISYAREKGIEIGAWTVDNTVYADVMAMFGADYITTNKLVP